MVWYMVYSVQMLPPFLRIIDSIGGYLWYPLSTACPQRGYPLTLLKIPKVSKRREGEAKYPTDPEGTYGRYLWYKLLRYVFHQWRSIWDTLGIGGGNNLIFGVDATWTRNLLRAKQMLYQLSYNPFLHRTMGTCIEKFDVPKSSTVP